MHPRLRQVPPECVLLDDRHLHPGRCGVQRGGVATRPATHHHQVKLLGRRDHLSCVSSVAPRRVSVAPCRPARYVAAVATVGELPAGDLVAAPEEQDAASARASATPNSSVHARSATVVAPHRPSPLRFAASDSPGTTRRNSAAPSSSSTPPSRTRHVATPPASANDSTTTVRSPTSTASPSSLVLVLGGLLIGDPPELDAAGEQDREPADHGEDQQGPGAHRRNATDVPSGPGLFRLTTIASRFDIVGFRDRDDRRRPNAAGHRVRR